MSRTLAYSVSLGLFLGATALTGTSILLPTWLTTGPHPSTPTISQGLHRLCTGTTCNPFPSPHLCAYISNRTNTTSSLHNFCTLWRTASFLTTLSLIIELVALLSFLLVLLPITGALTGQTKRRQGWKILLPLMGLIVFFEAAATAIVGYVFDHDEAYFRPYWRLGGAWECAVGSAVVVAVTAMGLGVWMVVCGRREERVHGEGTEGVGESLLGGRRDGGRGVGYGTGD